MTVNSSNLRSCDVIVLDKLTEVIYFDVHVQALSSVMEELNELKIYFCPTKWSSSSRRSNLAETVHAKTCAHVWNVEEPLKMCCHLILL